MRFLQKNVKITSEEVATGFLRCRKMALDIIKLYISLLGQFFTLSDISIASARKPGQSASQSSNLGQSTGHSEAAMPDFVPRNANSLITCHYASKILAEILDSAGEIDALTGPNSGQSVSSPVTSTDLGQEAKKAMRDFVESCRWRLEEAICETWSRGEYDARNRDAIHCGMQFADSLYSQMQRNSSGWKTGPSTLPQLERPFTCKKLPRSKSTTPQ